jgi:Tol biopolymer transport system component
MKICPSCKVRYEEDKAFCSRCGASLIEEISEKRKSLQKGKKTNIILLLSLIAIPVAFVIVAVFIYLNQEPTVKNTNKASQATPSNNEKVASTLKSRPQTPSLNEPSVPLASKAGLPANNTPVDATATSQEAGGNNLVFVRNGNVWIATSGGANPRQLAFIGQAENPALSPDGNLVAFKVRGQKGKPTKIFLMPTQGGKTRALNLQNIDYSDDPTFSPDGRQLLFRGRTFRDNNSTVSLVLANLQDFSLRQIISISGLQEEEADIMASPTFSPDGHLIVYQENDHEPISGFAIIDLAGKQIARFPLNPKADVSFLQPRFSPDGREVLCWSYDFKEDANRVGNHTIYLVNWRTGGKKILALGTAPSFVDGGKAIVFARRTSHNRPSDLYRLELAPGARPRLILQNAGSPAGQG